MHHDIRWAPIPTPISVTEIRAASAERYDIIIEPTERGTYLIENDIIHWVTGEVLSTTRQVLKKKK